MAPRGRPRKVTTEGSNRVMKKNGPATQLSDSDDKESVYRSSTRRLLKRSSSSSTDPSSATNDQKCEGGSSAAEAKRPLRKCDKSGCEGTAMVCCASACDKCAGDKSSSRWYHVSKSEHYCNECFEHFYRTTKAGYKTYMNWKNTWGTNSISEPKIKTFFTDQVLPFWVQCIKKNCRKWRVLPHDAGPLTKEIILSFTCGKYVDVKKVNFCPEPEHPDVQQALVPSWIEALVLPPLLKSSPAADLLGAYYADGVGLSPTCPRSIKAMRSYQERKIKEETEVPGMNQHFIPFYQPTETRRANCIRPDVMDQEEEKEFREYSREQIMYLAIRNLIITLWYQNCKKWLTIEDVAAHLICRGLTRIRCLQEADRILRFLTKRGTVNIGVLTAPPGFKLVPEECNANIIVIGAGVSGLGAAKHLQNFGFKVTILEARNRTGGRIWDDDSFGVCVGKGAQIVTGVTNNPISIICEQASLPMRYLGERCELYCRNGKVDATADKQMDFHFNAALDAVAAWRQTPGEDQDLYSRIVEIHNQFLVDSQMDYTEDYMNLFYFHLSNLEYACGANLEKVSARYWDQNDAFEQFAGDHTMLWLGYSALIDKLAEGLDIRLETIVKKIDYGRSNGAVVVETSDKTFEASHVLVTVPLAVLQAGDIQFDPPLPEAKRMAFAELGAGAIEKVAVQFPKCFWSSRIVGADFFGYVPRSSDERGQFPLFCDMSRHGDTAETSSYVLMTYLCGDSVKLISEKTDQEIVDLCVKILRDIFDDQEVPDPMNYFVTRWSQDPFSKMVYSYVKLGGTGETYDLMSEDVQKKLFFAGEATNRNFPQTVTGSYISGIREATKILNALS